MSLTPGTKFVNPPSPGYRLPDTANRAKNKKTAERALKVVMDGLAACKSARVGAISDGWDENYKAFRAHRARQEYFGRANVIDPEPSRVVETLDSRFLEGVLGQEPWIRGLPGPGEEMADRKAAEANESLIHYQLATGSRFEALLETMSKSCLIFGTAIARIFWEVDTQIRPRRKKGERLTGRFGAELEREAEQVILYEGPRIRPVDIRDFYVPQISRLEDETPEGQDFVIERRITTHRELKRLSRQKNPDGSPVVANIDDVKLIETSEGFASRMEYNFENVTTGTGEPPFQHNPALQKVELLMYEGAFDLDDDGLEEECWIWVAGETVIRCHENPNPGGAKSYISTHCIKAPGMFYGIASNEWILKMWNELCDRHNQALDNTTLALNPAIIAGATAGLDEDQWLMAPGAVLPVQGDVGQIKPLILPDNSRGAYDAIGFISSRIRETAGATDLMQGQAVDADIKATVFHGLITEASFKVKKLIRTWNSMFFCPLAHKMWALNQAFATQDQVVRILGREGFDYRRVRLQDLSYPMDWRGVGAAGLSTILQRHLGLERILATATPLVQAGLLQLDLPALFKQWYHAHGYSDGDRIFGGSGPRPMNPEHENLMLEQRQGVDPHPEEDHIAHIKAHLALKDHPDPVVAQMVVEHVTETWGLYQQIQELQARQAALQQMTEEAQLAQAQLAGRPTPPAVAGGHQPRLPQRPASPPAASANVVQMGPNVGTPKDLAEMYAGRQG